MPDRASPHSRAVAQMVDESKQALASYIARCKAMTPEDFAMEPRRMTSRLSAAQYTDIVRALCGSTTPPAPPAATPKGDAAQATSSPVHARVATSHWRKLVPKRWRPTAIAVLAGLTSVALGAAVHGNGSPSDKPAPLIRSRESAGWPSCMWLAPTVDGCLYRNTEPLDWSVVAQRLAQNRSTLRANNPHLTASIIPAGSAIVVWRGLGQLVEEKQ